MLIFYIKNILYIIANIKSTIIVCFNFNLISNMFLYDSYWVLTLNIYISLFLNEYRSGYEQKMITFNIYVMSQV